MTTRINTTKGPVSPDELGVTLSHEHILIDQTFFIDADPSTGASGKNDADDPVCLENLWLLKRNPYLCRDNIIMQDEEMAAKELKYFATQNGKTVVDVTNIGMGRNPEGLRRISHATGLHIVTSTGFYVEPGHPSFVQESSVEDLSNLMVKELLEGIDGTHIKAGLIGEIGTSMKLTAQEEKVLRASAKAHLKTGAAINIHLATMKGREGPKVLDILDEEKVDLNRVVLSHMDFILDDIAHLKRLAKRGAYLEFDSFGMDFSVDSKDFTPPCDISKVQGLKRLIDDGFAEQLLISQDICVKISLKAFGGQGYDHILRNVLPMMKKSGIDDETIHLLMVKNPARLLAF